MSLQLEPSHLLSFERPLTRMVKNHLTLENTGSEPIIFKVKTTAPKLYCVRPNVGRVDPHSKVQVEVYLQAFKEEPPLEKPCKDKFLILSASVDPADATADLHSTWSRIEATEKSRINQAKLRCEYRQPDNKPATILKQEEENLEVSTITADESSLPLAEENKENDALAQARKQLKEMQQKLDAYQGEISQLRQRNKNNTDDVSPTTTTFVKETRIESTGYPPYIVVLVALFAFALAWIALSITSS
ncbi:hypothetical protein LRAMOSA05059 [Lichtheimia ramosa]|uniref:MSP domain-containing protein n=1 Tax=Lichtheimia ramosa TaxID=688394 RepID=A0A077X001_9FUNG|nr:hypothetical protein LRAMOSA05059 [Lichtheimia ramosa]